MASDDSDLGPEITAALDSCRRCHTVSLLQAVQKRLGFLPAEALEAIAERVGSSPATVYGVATFYNQFRFTPPGKRHVRVCLGTACHIKRGGTIYEEWGRKLGIGDGEVTEDRAYSLERVACVGCCALAPVTVVGDKVHGNMTPAMVVDLITRHRLEDEREAKDARDDDASS